MVSGSYVVCCICLQIYVQDHLSSAIHSLLWVRLSTPLSWFTWHSQSIGSVNPRISNYRAPSKTNENAWSLSFYLLSSLRSVGYLLMSICPSTFLRCGEAVKSGWRTNKPSNLEEVVVNKPFSWGGLWRSLGWEPSYMRSRWEGVWVTQIIL